MENIAVREIRFGHEQPKEESLNKMALCATFHVTPRSGGLQGRDGPRPM